MKLGLFLLISIVSLQLNAQSPAEIGKYYFVELIPNEEMPAYSKAELDSIQMGHMMNIRILAEAGKLVLAGPFKDGGGLFILKVDSEESAATLLSSDPAVAAEKFSYEIREWYTEKRMFTLESK
ncbi:MAG: hypothetical protein Tsb0034_20080 [Ekhidna sp.]